MTVLSNIVAYTVPFLLVLTLVVTIHELGHFLVARSFGMAVDRFSIGFGRAIASFHDRWGVEWRLGWLPLGGYVRFRGDADASSSVPDAEDLADLRGQVERLEGAAAVKRYFHFRPVWQRALVVAAGPAANFVLSIALFTGLLLVFGTQVTTPRVGGVLAGSPAAAAGFRAGDLITRVDGAPIDSFEDVAEFTQLRSGEPIRFTVKRAAAELQLTATPVRLLHSDPITGARVAIGTVGLRGSGDPRDLVRRSYTPQAAALGAVKMTAHIVNTTVFYVGRIFRGRESGDQLRGPVGLASAAGGLTRAAVAGHAPFAFKVVSLTASLLSLAALISTGLGFMNLLPIPVLDGGHLVFYALEWATRRPLNARVQAVSYRLGLMLLLGLMLFATWNNVRELSLFKTIGGLFS